jgi:DNA-binding FadR family transcriptional regulator
LPYSFAPSILVSSAYAIEISSTYFDQYRDMRNHLEAVYFYEAVALLNPDDMQQLLKIIDEAEKKIGGMPPKSPNIEHRDWHLMLFSHIDNVFVKGFLTVYWEIYQKQDYAFVSDSIYLRNVWSYHRKITEQILVSDFSKAYQTFLEHKDLIKLSPKPVPNHKFE